MGRKAAPEAGVFGALGHCTPEARLTRKVYVAGFVVVLLYAEVPWAELLLAWFRG